MMLADNTVNEGHDNDGRSSTIDVAVYNDTCYSQELRYNSRVRRSQYCYSDTIFALKVNTLY